jgi:transcriptional regulator with XRE-family HTH domain
MPDISDELEIVPETLPKNMPRKALVGALLREAREHMRQTRRECAEMLGITTARFGAYESGEHEPTLPEIEMLATLWRIPALVLLSDSADQLEAHLALPQNVPEAMQLRSRIIGIKLAQARLNKGETLDQTAKQVGISPRRLEDFERGDRDAPLTTLEALGKHLNLSLKEMLDLGGDEIPTIAQLPEPVRALVADPNASGYLDTAVRLRTLPASEIAQLGQALVKLSEIV